MEHEGVLNRRFEYAIVRFDVQSRGIDVSPFVLPPTGNVVAITEQDLDVIKSNSPDFG